MKHDPREIRDQISLASSYHYTMALAYLVGGAAILVYAVLPRLQTAPAELAQALFPPAVGTLLTGVLSLLYGSVARGLGRLRNGARMGAVFLALLGSVGGAFAVMGSIAGAIQAQPQGWLPIGVTAVASIAAYFLITAVDLLLLLFLLSGKVRDVFYSLEAEPAFVAMEEPTHRKDGAKAREAVRSNSS